MGTHGSPKVIEEAPYVPASTSLPEITLKAVVLGVILSVVLGGANAYLGLFAGITVSASPGGATCWPSGGRTSAPGPA